MMFFAITILIVGLFGFIWNLCRDTRRIDGSSVSLLFTFLVGIGLLLEPDSISLPFVNYQKKTKEEYQQAVAYSNSIKELLAIQLWNQGRLPDENSALKNKEKAIELFKNLYGNNYKAVMKSLSDSSTLLISDEELIELGLDKVNLKK